MLDIEVDATLLGSEGAKKVMWEHYCDAVEALQEVTFDPSFLLHLLKYFIYREQ